VWSFDLKDYFTFGRCFVFLYDLSQSFMFFYDRRVYLSFLLLQKKTISACLLFTCFSVVDMLSYNSVCDCSTHAAYCYDENG